MAQEFKRFPALEKKVSEIRESDVRVCISGFVVDHQDQTLILDDGTGKIKITLDTQLANIPKAARVIGRVIPFQGGVEIHGEIVQNMENLDLDVFKKLTSIR